MTCIFCQKGPKDGTTIFRISAKGQPGVWACERHMKQTAMVSPEEVKRLMDALQVQP